MQVPYDDSDPETKASPKRGHVRRLLTGAAAFAAILGSDDFGVFPAPFRPTPQPEQTDEQRASALLAAEERRARRRAKRAAAR